MPMKFWMEIILRRNSFNQKEIVQNLLPLFYLKSVFLKKEITSCKAFLAETKIFYPTLLILCSLFYFGANCIVKMLCLVELGLRKLKA